MSNKDTQDYKKIVKELGVKHLFGKYGYQILPRGPGNIGIYKLFSIVALDDWITDPAEIERTMRKQGMEL